ncbi:MAG TPA: HAMP domain-containing sensor histidine kinase [Thermoanaerobaculia bacterium]
MRRGKAGSGSRTCASCLRFLQGLCNELNSMHRDASTRLDESTPRGRLTRWAVAVGAPLLAALVSRVLDPFVAPYTTPPYMLAVMIAAAYGGIGPGLLASAMATLCLAWIDVGGRFSFNLAPGEIAEVIVFLVAAVLVSSLAAARSAAQHRLEKALQDLAALDRAKDEFIATMSHELRTPLTSIQGWLQLLHNGNLDDDTRALAMRSIEESTQTQRMLVDDLLDVSRIVLGKLTIEREVAVLNDAVAGAADVIRPMAEEKSIRIQYEPARETLVVRGDLQRLKQVVWNLLSNAVKFTPRHGRITVSLHARGRRGIIVVTDDGTGIEPEVLPHVFDRFRQGTGATRKGGLGLGLAICRHIVEEHGGSIAIHSDGPDRGTAVTVEIPLIDARGSA